MKTLINAVTVIALLLLTIVSVMSTVSQALPVVLCLVLVILFLRTTNAFGINNSTEIEVEDVSVLDTEFVSLADDVGFELFLEFIEEEDFDISGDFQDGVIVCWISNPGGVAMTEAQLQSLVDMQAFLTKWA